MKYKLKIVLAQLNPIVGDVKGNIIKLIKIRDSLSEEIDIIVVPELYVTGYPIDDLVLRNDFLELVENEIISLAKLTNDGKAAIILGAPRKENKSIKNSVFVLDKGEILSSSFLGDPRIIAALPSLVNLAKSLISFSTSSKKSFLSTKSSIGYPVTYNSGTTIISTSLLKSFLIEISLEIFPLMSPTLGFNWASAIFILFFNN